MIDVRREVLSVTNGKQVPWDHSALTGDFYFHLASAPGTLPKTAPAPPAAESEALQQRLRQVEEELKKKSDPQHTVKLVELAQLKERIRRIEEDNRADQQRIFDTYRKYPGSDPASRASVSREIGAIQMQMARRNEDRRRQPAIRSPSSRQRWAWRRARRRNSRSTVMALSGPGRVARQRIRAGEATQARNRSRTASAGFGFPDARGSGARSTIVLSLSKDAPQTNRRSTGSPRGWSKSP